MLQGRQGRVRIALALILGLVVWGLLAGESPSSAGIARALELGHNPKPLDYWATYGWAFGWVDVALLALLIALVPRWLGEKEAPEVAELARRPAQRLGVLLVLAAMVSLGVLAAPRLSHSLWDDEVSSVYRSIAGGWRVDSRTGEPHYDKARWSDTFWYYRKPNNHVPHSILARGTVKIPEKRPDRRVSETAVRMPAFVFGVLAVGSVAWMLWRLGFGLAGVYAAWLLALHPWLLRYAAEARGYSMAMCLSCLTITAAVSALHHGLWRRWLGFGFTQFILFWVQPSLAWFLVVLNLGVLASLIRLHPEPSPRRQQLTRWAGANLLGVMSALPLMAPLLPQLLVYLEEGHRRVWITAAFLRNVGADLVAGTDWHHGGAPLYPELSAVGAAHPFLVSAVVAAIVVGLGAGALRLARAGGVQRNLMWALLLPAPVTLVFLALRGDRTYTWYFVNFLPSLVSLVALGASWLAARERGQGSLRAIGGGILVVGLVAHAWIGAPARHALRERPYFPLRESVALTRPNPDPRAAENKEILTASWESVPHYYDPLMHYVRQPGELEAIMKEADASDRPLFVNLGRKKMAALHSAEDMALVEDPSLFELLETFPGYKPTRTRYVYRYLGRAGQDEVENPSP
ncbi:MAG: hypothetical protein JRH01_01830 [Deltaproteobacteria bacterium]|nr:hypothetical protein [Deltaproteobacteria bacterium]MBW2395990.1 hypothetical protein [Deltaproteobacteria bacterium]